MKCIEQIIYGIQAAKDVKLSSITRALGEETALKKTSERLSRNLGTPGMGEKINEILARHAGQRVREDTLILIDPSDIRKDYAKKMPYLGYVRDGDTGEIVSGYWICNAVACEPRSRRIIPLHQRLWSAEAPDFESENKQILQIVDTIRKGTKGRGIYVLDRGGDREKLIIPFLERGMRFIIRLKGDRKLIFRGKARAAIEIAAGCPMVYADTIVKEEGGGEKTYCIQYGYRPVRMRGCDEQLYLMVVKGYGSEPIMLLTSVPVRKNRNVLWSIVNGYFTRWLIEESVRFIKQSYSLEDIRMLKYERLKNMVALVMASVYFTAVWLGASLKHAVLTVRVTKIAKRFFGIPEFHYYALADGISVLLTYLGRWVRRVQVKLPMQRNGQLLLFDPI